MRGESVSISRVDGRRAEKELLFEYWGEKTEALGNGRRERR